MIRQAFSRARQTAVAAVFGASLALAPAPAHAFWDTKKAWNDMLQFAVKQVNAPGEFEIILGEVTKPEEGFALISTLQIKDGDGIWLDASNLLVDWSPTALLRGRFIFDTLSAEEIAILRAPIGRGDPPADEAQVAFAWPRPPVPIGIDALKVDRLRIEGGLLPQDIEAKVTGAFKDIGDVQDATLVVQRTDRPGDRIALTSQIDFDDLDIAFKLEANEEPGGLVAEMASLPPDQALKLDLESKGTPENLAFELFADIGQIGIAKGKGSTSFNGLITAKFDGRIEPGEKTADDWRRALGEAALIKVDFAEVSKGTYDLKMLEIDSPAFELDGKGEVDVAGNKIDLALNWDAKDIAAFNQVIAPASVTELDGTARAVGRLSAPKLDVNAKVAGLDAAFGKADAVLLRIDSEPLTQDRETPGAPQGFTFEAKADGLALADESLQEALGPTPSFAGKGQFNGVENRVTLDTLKIDARSVQLDGNAAYDIGTGSMDAELSGEARELGPFFKAAGVPVDGRAALAFKLEGLQSGTLDRLFLNAQMSNLSSTDADIAAALGEEAILELLLTESGADTIEVERGVFESNVLKAEASGAISIPGDTVDLTVAFDVLDADAIAGLIEPAEVGDAEGKATLTGTLSEPQVSVKATASDLGFEDYAAESAQIDGSVQYRKDRRAPFALTAALEGVTTGDDDLDAVVGASPQVEATGLYDTATGLLSLSKMEADLADADLSLTGDVQLRKKTLDVAYDLEAGDLSGFSGLIGKPLDGSVDISGRAEGPFALPFVTAKGTARDLRFDTYSVDAADLDIEMLPGDDGPAPFKLDVTAINPKTGDAALDELIGENPSLRAKGTLDREGPAIVLEYLDADLATMKAEAKGSVDVGTRLMDLAFDVDASELDGLTALLGTEVAGAVTANGSAKGSFAAPEVDAAIDATGLRYGDYAVGSVKGSLDIQQAASGYAPFDIDIEARDVTTGDAALDDLLADASTVKAKGAFNQAEQKLRLESATVIAAGAVASASGDIDIAGKALDVAFEVEAEDLSAFEGLAGVALDGTVSAKGTAAGTLAAPEVDVALTGRGLRYGQYRVGEIDGKIDIAQAPNGFAPFDIDVVVQDVTTGDVALDDLLADASTVKAKGAFNQAEQKLRLESATVIAAGAVASASGNIDIAGKALDVAFEVEAEDLSAFEGLAGVTLDGTVSAKGTAAGTLTAPEVDVALTGRGLRYDGYSAASLDGVVAIEQAETGYAPFKIDARANGLSLGDPALNEAFKDGVKIDAAGGFDRSAQRIRLDRGRFETDAATADVTGVVNLGAKRLDVAFDVDASDLGVFGKIAGVDAGGALKAKGTAKGPFVIPQVNASVSGRKLRYDAYRVASLDGAVAMDTATDGVAPFDMDIKASGIRTGDAALDEAIGDEVRVDATGGFDAKAQKLRLDAAKLTADFATADLSGRVDLAAKTLDLAFDVDAARLAPLSPILGTDIAGAVAMQGTAKGPFSLPAINAGLAGRGIAYDKYGIARLDGRIDTGTAAGDALPFDVDLTAGGITTGDPVLDDALGENVRVDARGRFDRGANVLRLTEAALLSDFAEATASGTVNLGAKTLDIAFDMDAKRLAAFGPLAKAELGGSLALSGTAKGAFVIPMVDAAIDGEAIRFNQYSIGRLNGSVDVGQAVNGALPFDIDVTAAGLVTGDAALDQTIGEAVTVDATGTFAPDSQVVVLDAARFRADFATANASGRVDLKTQTLDVGFDVEAADLSPFSAVTGQAMAGSVAMRGSARGPFNIPAVDANIAARRLTFGAYGAGQLDGALSLGLAKDGFAPFSVDMTGGGLSLGDPALDAAFGSRVDIDATGAVDIAQKRIRIDRAKLATDAAAAALNGSVDLGAKTVDLAFDVEAANLAPFGPLASADLAGSMAMKGRATGPFVIPRVNANIAGSGIRYNQYTVGRIDGTVDMDSPQNGVTPFTVGLNTAGIGTGNPALDDLLRPEVRLAANGGFNQSAKLLRLDEARVTSALAQVSARGTVDLAAQMLDLTFGVDAGEIAPLSGLVGADLAGALALGGSVSGPFASPSIATTLDGRALRYQQYTVASLTGTASFSQVAGGYGPFAIDAAAAGIGTGDPSLDFALKDGVSVKGAGGFDATNQRLRLDRFTAQARFASVDASGLVDLGMKSMDVTFALDASDLSPLSAVIGKPMGGALKASGTARGAFSAPVVNMNAQGGGLYFDQYSLGGLSLNLTMPGDAPGYLPFTLTGNVSQPRLNNPQIEYLIGETVTVRAEGVFDPTRQLLRLTDSQVQTNSAWVGAFGDVDLTNRMLAVEYHANLLDLSIAQQIAGKTLAGAARLRGQISGSLDDPSTSGQLTGQGLVYDRYRMTSLTAQYDLQRLVTGPAGAVSLDGQTEFGPLAASARFDLTGGALQVQQISVNGLGIGLDGNFRTGTNGTLAGAATLMATDLAQLGAFLGQDIAGRVDGSVTLTDEQGRQNAVFDIRGGDFRYGPAANPTAQFAAFEARGQVADAFGRDPYLDATFGGSNGKIAAFPVNRIDATARGTFSALDTTVTASGGALGSDKVELVARVNGVNPPRSASVTRLALAYQGRQATIIEPLVIEEIVPRGWRLRNLDLRAEDGEVRGSAEYGPSGLVADLTIRNFPLALASLSGVDLIQSGRLDGNLDIDTRGGVRGTFDLAAVSLRLKGAQIDDPFAITAKGVMDGQALNVTAEMTGAELVMPLVANARIPLRRAPGSPLPTPDINAPFSGAVDWTGDVGEIWAFVPLPDHILSGPVIINGRAGGTLAAPQLSGGAELTDGRYSNIEFGTLLTNLNAKVSFTQDGRVVFDLTGNDGVEGTVAASGSYIVASSTLDSRLSLNNAALVRRDDATAILSGDATAVSQGRDIKIDGQFRTNYVELRLIGNFGGSLTVVEAIPVGKSAPLYVPPEENAEPARNIFLNVSLDLPNRVFVRGRGLDSEWGGRLDVTGSAAKPRIVGAIERRRGFLDFLGKQFELSIGVVRFSGDTSPFVQVRLQRDANDIVGWIEVKGTVPDLDIEFGSIPALPEGEILPRLLFGRSKQSLTALEAGQLAAGVATLLSGKAGVLDSVRDAVGVDVLRVESDVDGGTSVITGKYLQDEVFVGAKQNLFTGETSGLVEVEVFDNFEFEAELGSEEAQGSVGWQIEY